MTEVKEQGPAWRAIADELRSDVTDEVYPPGGPLPGESQLAERHGVSRPTVRRAINVLVGEGLLTASHGRGTFVRPRPDRRVILINSPEPVDLLADDYDPTVRDWLPWEHAKAEELRRRGTEAPDGVITAIGRNEAEMLRIPTRTQGFYRYRNWRHRTFHQSIAVTSVIPAHLLGVWSEPQPEEPADLYDWSRTDPENPYRPRNDDDGYEPDDSELESPEEPDDAAEGGAGEPEYTRLLRERGPVRFVSTVTARMPVGDEAADLEVPTGTAMLEVRRVMTDTHGRPLELTTIAAPADRFEVANAPEWLAATRPTGGDAAAVLRL
ncbi:GntR family transcriptional regulator [Streptomyces alboflavus]|uniref:GntR family transcriptional regulator n=1 Tax=Streptomyces alboflavus TaxID=67267 RepID=UPI0036C59A32